MDNNQDFEFSEAVTEIKEINEWFRRSEVDLDQGLKKFRRGMSLIKQCRQRLEEAENQFEDIQEQFTAEKKDNE